MCRAGRSGKESGRRGGVAVRPEGPWRVASPRASMRQCADAPPVVIVIRRPETVKRAGVRSTRSASRRRLQPVPVNALQQGALAVHVLVAEAGEQQAHLGCTRRRRPPAARRGRQGRGDDAHQLAQVALRLAAFAVQRASPFATVRQPSHDSTSDGSPPTTTDEEPDLRKSKKVGPPRTSIEEAMLKPGGLAGSGDVPFHDTIELFIRACPGPALAVKALRMVAHQPIDCIAGRERDATIEGSSPLPVGRW